MGTVNLTPSDAAQFVTVGRQIAPPTDCHKLSGFLHGCAHWSNQGVAAGLLGLSRQALNKRLRRRQLPGRMAEPAE
jgi:hypothetical protein